MAKLTRVVQKIFGSNAGTSQRAVFGSLAAGSPAFSTDPATIQSLGAYLEGWFSAVIGGNSPTIEDMNALQFLESRQLAYLYQAGVPEWDADTTYYIGSVVNDSGTLYRSIADNNLNNAVSDTSKWKGFSTDPVGTMKPYLGSSAPAGYVFADGLTIGSATSGATERANADTIELYTMLWDAYSNTILPIQDSSGTPTTRGASASIDFAANKRLPLPDLRGRVPAGRDDMGGSAANRLTSTTVTPNGTTLGASGGAQTHTLTTAELATHTHGITDPGHQHLDAWPEQGGGGNFGTGTGPFSNSIYAGYTATTSYAKVASATTGITADNAGSGNAHNNVQPTWVTNYIIKL